MRFKDTLMCKVLKQPGEIWEKLNLYSFVLATPMLLLFLSVGFLTALAVDFFFACREVCENG